jgi:hypothetical protein
MNARFPVTQSRSDAYVAVSTALSLYSVGNIASTRTVLRAVRKLSPVCSASDEELIALIVSIASGRTMGVSFDHREAC